MDPNKDITLLSDEDFMKADPSLFLQETQEQEPVKTEEIKEEEEKEEIVEEQEVVVEEQQEEQETVPLTKEQEELDKSIFSGSEEVVIEDPEPKETEDENKDKEEPKEKEENSEVSQDLKDELYKTIFTPFKANGTDFQVRDPEEAKRLIQMGVGYSSKMAGLKPALKVVRLLQEHDMMDIDKVNYLIDLGSKKPEAISKLVKESGIDPLDIDLEQADTYKPSERTIDEKADALKDELESLRDSPSYNEVIAAVESMDEASQAVFYNNPQGLRMLDAQVASGVYEQVMGEVKRRQILGEIPSYVPIMEAYQVIGKELANAGKLPVASGSQQEKPNVDKPMTPDPETVRAKREAKRKKVAAGAAKSQGKPTTSSLPKSFNPLDLSDEEFEKFNADPRYGIKAFEKLNS